MKKRPLLRRGDLVKLKKPYDNGTMFRVTRITVNNIERRRVIGYVGHVTTSEGFIDVHVVDKDGTKHAFKRRDLWRVPNQPRDKVRVTLRQSGLY